MNQELCILIRQLRNIFGVLCSIFRKNADCITFREAVEFSIRARLHLRRLSHASAARFLSGILGLM